MRPGLIFSPVLVLPRTDPLEHLSAWLRYHPVSEVVAGELRDRAPKITFVGKYGDLDSAYKRAQRDARTTAEKITATFSSRSIFSGIILDVLSY